MRDVDPRCINLTFHGVGDPERTLEPAEADVWLSARRFAAVLDAVAGRDDVHLTFDDGNASDLEHALPALADRGLRATFFVVAGRLGTPGFLDVAGVRALADAGMTIGSHGMRHRPWRALDDGALREELLDARQRLEEIVQRPVAEAGCPFGSYDRRVLGRLRRDGYERVYTSDRGTARAGAWLQARNSVGPADGDGLLDAIAGADGRSHRALLRRAKRAVKRWR
jgi:peptidoglycan/xylan/chitin deacetylase (PgdA/CDA1 family)